MIIINNTNFDNGSVKLLMETAKCEYDNEYNRISIIDNKASIILPVVSAYFLAIAQMNDYEKIFSYKITSFVDLIVPSLLFLTYTSSLIIALVAIIMLVSVVSTRNYQNIKSSDLYDVDYLKNESIFLQIELVNLYITTTEFNKMINDTKIAKYQNSWKFTIASIILFVLYILSKNIF